MTGTGTPAEQAGGPAAAPLRAVTVALPGGTGPHDAVDPVALAGGRGWLFASPALTLAALGTARVLPMARGLADAAARARLAEVLGSVAVRDEVGRPGTGVVALGALPFDPDEPATLTVPATIYGRDRDGEWVTVVFSDAAPPRLRDPVHLRRELLASAGHSGDVVPPPARLGATLQARPSGAGYAAAVAAAVDRMAGPGLDKVVLARCLHATFDRPPDPVAVLGRLCDQEPSCTVFAMPLPGPDPGDGDGDGDGVGRFLGASPELLLSRRGRKLVSRPLAGTVGLGGSAVEGDDPAVEALLGSAKDQREHRFVVEHLTRALTPFCGRLDVPDRPAAVRLRSVAHLQTELTGTLRADRPSSAGSLELLAALHPTPAVGGTPTARARGVISELEVEPRHLWAGAVGWTGESGDGDWFLGIRSAELDGTQARLLAGAGIVAGSVPDDELAETTLKLRPVLEALAPGSGSLLDDRDR